MTIRYQAVCDQCGKQSNWKVYLGELQAALDRDGWIYLRDDNPAIQGRDICSGCKALGVNQ